MTNLTPCRCRHAAEEFQLATATIRGVRMAYGDLPPFTGPCDCPVCHGSGIEGVVGTIIPHSSFGDPDCCGCLNPIVQGDHADIVCNECESIVRTVPSAELQKTLNEMELSLDMSTEMCPFCRSVNVLPGFSKVMTFTCRECGKLVRLSDDTNAERFFGKPDDL
jgi:hypothetical protein